MAVKKNPFPFPFEYCSVSRTAKLFDCEIDDIWHLLRCEKIKAYIDLDEYESHSNYGCNGYVLIPQKEKAINDKMKNSKAIRLSNNLTRILIKTPSPTQNKDKEENQFNDGKSYSLYTSELHISGFVPVDYWFLFNENSGFSMVEHEQDNYIFCFSLHDDRNPKKISLPNEEKTDAVESLRNQIKPLEDEVFILRADLESIFKAMNSGQPMPRKLNKLAGINTGSPDSLTQPQLTDNEIDKMKITIAGLTLLLADTSMSLKTGNKPNIGAIHQILQKKVSQHNAQLANERSKNLSDYLSFLENG